VSERACKLRKAGMTLKYFSRNGDKTHCAKGHPYDRFVDNGKGSYKRVCSVCYLESRRQRSRAHRFPKQVMALSAKLQKLLEAQESVGSVGVRSTVGGGSPSSADASGSPE
jgi:hypothetical protein